ncbi:hypothetical protein ACKWTF_003987 [Chironomus riparius]
MKLYFIVIFIFITRMKEIQAGSPSYAREAPLETKTCAELAEHYSNMLMRDYPTYDSFKIYSYRFGNPEIYKLKDYVHDFSADYIFMTIDTKHEFREYLRHFLVGELIKINAFACLDKIIYEISPVFDETYPYEPTPS